MSTSYPNEPFSDEELLMRQFREGDKDAFTAIYTSYLSRVINFINAIIKDRSAAGDLTAEVFYRLFHARQRFYRLDKILPWLILTSRTIAIQYLKVGPHSIKLTLLTDEVLNNYRKIQPALVFSIEYSLRKGHNLVANHQIISTGIEADETNAEVSVNSKEDIEKWDRRLPELDHISEGHGSPRT
jgi:DNA-directed RNA polymerase specialized sigma24 family protein